MFVYFFSPLFPDPFIHYESDTHYTFTHMAISSACDCYAKYHPRTAECTWIYCEGINSEKETIHDIKIVFECISIHEFWSNHKLYRRRVELLFSQWISIYLFRSFLLLLNLHAVCTLRALNASHPEYFVCACAARSMQTFAPERWKRIKSGTWRSEFNGFRTLESR